LPQRLTLADAEIHLPILPPGSAAAVHTRGRGAAHVKRSVRLNPGCERVASRREWNHFELLAVKQIKWPDDARLGRLEQNAN